MKCRGRMRSKHREDEECENERIDLVFSVGRSPERASERHDMKCHALYIYPV